MKKKKGRVNIYVLQVEEENNRNCKQKKRIIAQRNRMMDINHELFDLYISYYIYIYILQIEEFYMNKKSKAN